MITNKQSQMIDMLLEGRQKTDIAKVLNVSRQSLYTWMEMDKVKAEMDRRQQVIINHATKGIIHDVDRYINNLKILANDIDGDKRTAAKCNELLLSYVLGKPSQTIVTEDKMDNKKEEFDLDILDEVDLGKVVKLKRK